MTELTAPSFAKPPFLGELHETMVTPYPRVAPDEQRSSAVSSSVVPQPDGSYVLNTDKRYDTMGLRANDLRRLRFP